MMFFGLSVAAYGALIAWLADRLDASTAEWGYALAHLVLAATVNAFLIRSARARSLSLLGSAPVAFLVVSQLYFTINGLKYFSPILGNLQLEMSLTAQFVGSAAGALVLFACAFLLRRQRGPESGRVLAWIDRYWADLRRLMIVSVAGSLICKAALFELGYGSTYTDTAYSDRAVRTYSDFFILLGNDTFGMLALLLGMLYLLRRRAGRPRPATGFAALIGVLIQVGYALIYLKARLILLVTFVILALTAEVRSRRLAERLLQVMLIVLPAASLLGVQLTLWLGRVNLPEDTGMRLGIAAINRRADLTDFATAIVVDSDGKAHDAAIITAAVLNAIPRMVFPHKQDVVKDVYSDILEKHLGWPAYAGGEMIADYQDSAFSAGVMAFGTVGFVLVPLGLIWGLYLLCRALERTFHGLAYGVGLFSLWIAALRIEIEWSAIPLSLRSAAAMGIVAYVVLWISRLFHGALRVSIRPPHPVTGAVDPGATPV
jgi:hypothetical protein